MGMVDENKRVNFYEGKCRVVNPKGEEYALFDYHDYVRPHRGVGRTMDIYKANSPEEDRMEWS